MEPRPPPPSHMLDHARCMPQNPLELLDRQPASEAPAAVLLGTLDERLAECSFRRRRQSALRS